MAKTNILPIVGAAAAMYLLMRRGGGSIEDGISSLTHSVGGYARAIKHDLLHGDLLLAPEIIKLESPGDTVRMSGVNPDWAYTTASKQYDPAEQAKMVELFHDKGTGILYATSLADSIYFREAGPDSSIDVVGTAPGGTEVTRLVSLTG